MADQIASLASRGGAAVTTAVQPRTIVVGLGNPVLGDDGVGWRVADAVEDRRCVLRARPAAAAPRWTSSGSAAAVCG